MLIIYSSVEFFSHFPFRCVHLSCDDTHKGNFYFVMTEDQSMCFVEILTL